MHRCVSLGTSNKHSHEVHVIGKVIGNHMSLRNENFSSSRQGAPMLPSCFDGTNNVSDRGIDVDGNTIQHENLNGKFFLPCYGIRQ